MLVKPDDMPGPFPRPHDKMVPQTFWQIVKAENKVEQLVTVMPDGLRVAWGGCHLCHNDASRCICKVGFVHPRSIEHIYITQMMKKDGVEMQHNGTVNVFHPEYQQRGLLHYVGKETGNVSTGGTVIRPTKITTQPRRSLRSKPAAPEKRSLTRGKPAADLERNYDTEAGSKADALTKELTRKLGQSPKPRRTLKRK